MKTETINQQSEMDSVISPTEPEIQQDAEHYLLQRHCLTLIWHLTLMMLQAQKHRGSSMALLAGDEAFEVPLMEAQRAISRFVNLIGKMNLQYGSIISAEKWDEIQEEWLVLTHNWRSDSVLTSFELHNHFIDCLIKMIWEISTKANMFSPAGLKIQPNTQVGEDSPGISERSHHNLVHIVLKIMPELIENIAKIRGMATHVCARGICDAEYSARFSFFLQTLAFNKEQLRNASKSLRHDALVSVPALPEILLHEHKLSQLQELVDKNLLVQGNVELKSADVFNFVTEIIEIYSRVIRDGVLCFQQRLEKTWLGSL